MPIEIKHISNSSQVSILIPVYNCEAFLGKCLESVTNQTYENLQIVLIDDGSKDESWTIMQEFALHDNRIEIYRQENKGVAATRNNLLGKANGDFVLFVDSDDWLEPNTVERLISEQIQGDYDIVAYEPIGSHIAYDDVKSKREIIPIFLSHSTFNGALWNKLFKRSLLEDLFFDPTISYGEDALFTWHVIQRVQNVRRLPDQLYHHTNNDESLSNQSFGEKKKTGHKVWKTIVDETQRWWPQHLDIARARFAVEDMWQLYFAACDGYPHDDYIKMLQRHVRKELSLIKRSGLIDCKKLLFAWSISHCFALGKLLKQ